MDLPPSALDGDQLWSVVAGLTCLVLSFVFSGSETAITSMGEHKLRRLIDQKVGPTGLFELWQRDHSKVLTSILAGNTLVNMLLSAMVTTLTLQTAPTAAKPSWFSEWIVTLSVVAVTVIVLIVGEIVPKTLAKSHPEWFLRLLWLVHGFHLATRWLTAGLTWFSKTLVRLLGVDTDTSGFVVTEEQIEDMVRIGSEEGSIDVSRGDLLKNVFDLWDTPIRNVMTPRTEVVGIPGTATAEQILTIVKANGYSRYPVFGDGPDDVLGIFYAKQLIEAEGEVRAGRFELRRHVRKPLFVPENQKASTLLQTFRAKAVHVAVVVDEHGGTAGIVSLEDILEELVGDIYDEFDEIEPLIVADGEDRWLVDGAADMRAVAQAVRVSEPDEDQGFSTMAGYVLHHLGRMPSAGDEVMVDGLKIMVLEVDARKIRRVEIVRLPPPGSLESSAETNEPTPMLSSVA